jgi:1,4-dihydroxy-2-naphthoyl-CoA synthase
VGGGNLRTLPKIPGIGQMLLWQTEDHDEGIAAFMEKRKPKYQGR